MIWVKQGLRMYSMKFFWNQWCRDGLPWSYNQDFKPCKKEEEKVETYFCGAFLENLVLIQNLYNLQTRIICSTRPWPGHPVEGKTSKSKVSYTNPHFHYYVPELPGFQKWLILYLLGMAFHARVVLGLFFYFSFKSTWTHCDPFCIKFERCYVMSIWGSFVKKLCSNL